MSLQHIGKTSLTGCEITLETIRKNAAGIQPDNVRRILVLHEERITHIGDFCVRFDKLKYFRSYYVNAAIDINFALTENHKYYKGLLTNNPHVSAITTLAWKDIPFDQYDLVFCALYDENRLLSFLHNRYVNLIDRFNVAVCSMSEVLLSPADNANYIFTVNEELIAHVRVRRPGELYITKSEQEWANHWLEAQGIKGSDKLFIMLDSTTRRSKMLRMHIYFEFLGYLLKKEDAKVLVFDENNMGKEDFYREWLGEANMQKIIFSKKLELRQDLSLIASKYTRFIFGPCTGLMHCSSAIYNNYVNEGMDVRDVPVMITYTGQYNEKEGSANLWWGQAPLVNCLLLQERNNALEVVELKTLPEDSRDLYVQLPCSGYTTQMLIDFVESRLVS